MANTIKIKRSNVAGVVPTTLADGELALNQADKILFYKDNLGIIRSLNLVNSGSSAPKWLDILVGASSSSFNATIATGTVVNYVFAGVTYYRLMPSGTEKEAFYSTFSGGVLSGLVNYKIQ